MFCIFFITMSSSLDYIFEEMNCNEFEIKNLNCQFNTVELAI